MRAHVFGRAVLVFVLVTLTFLRSTYSASGNPQLEKARTNAQNLGYTFIGSHDEILAGAKREGKTARPQ